MSDTDFAGATFSESQYEAGGPCRHEFEPPDDDESGPLSCVFCGADPSDHANVPASRPLPWPL